MLLVSLPVRSCSLSVSSLCDTKMHVMVKEAVKKGRENYILTGSLLDL